MSKISKFFKGGGSSSSKGRRGPSPQEALARLRETEEMLSKKQVYLETRIERELTLARQHGTKNKRAALQALKRKKRYEKQLSQIDGTLSTIEFQREALENSHTNTEVLKNMGYAAQAMKKVHENILTSKKIHLVKMLTLGKRRDLPRGCDSWMAEDELMAELEELEQEELNKGMRDVRLPSVPSTSLPSRPVDGYCYSVFAASTRKRAEDEDEMKKLAAWAS
ncbi:CHM4C protein, partial [Probosciger aterrimus]|nr:CHM4C protein [Probosciger aterrimus]